MSDQIYLAGPMSGIPEYNFPAFTAAAKVLRAMGWEVFNPAETDNGDTSKPYDHYMRQDLKAIADCQAICLLPGWQDSKGATLEAQNAMALGLKAYKIDGPTVTPFKIQDELPASLQAFHLTHGDRNVSYGHPSDDIARMAALWSVILGKPVTTTQVCLCMVALKISRACNGPKLDNESDGCGYFELIGMIRRHEKAQAQLSVGTPCG